jgi:flavin reductase (DIM6/NTAB) family NADH-FMN oxidoreductase RutF
MPSLRILLSLMSASEVTIRVGQRTPGENIHDTGQFVINRVSEEMAEAMNITAIGFEPGVSELAEAKLEIRRPSCQTSAHCRQSSCHGVRVDADGGTRE